MLRKIRIFAATVFFVLITLLFLDFTGTIHAWFGWMAKLQFWPAVLALNVGVVIGLVILTLLLGRVYCSVICPLGVMQDVISWVSGKRKKKKFRFSYSPAKSILRYAVLAVFVVACVAGVGSLVALLAPYSAYGRIASNLFAPVYQAGNNLLAYFAEQSDSYAFYRVDTYIKGIGTFVVALVSLVVIAVLAWRNGRTYCNTICPVGTILGFLARFSLLKPHIDLSKCNGCGVCARKCKASCIDAKNHVIDYSRCVACMDCLDNCHQQAIRYGKPVGAVTCASAQPTASKAEADQAADPSRRRALAATAVVTLSSLAAKAQQKKEAVEMKKDGGFAPIKERVEPDRASPLTPPGSLSLKNLTQHCTGCQLCVSVCENHVLRPSGNLMTLMQPVMSYDRGYCRPECTKCSEVCPAGAIKPITKADKSAIQIGHAVWVKDLCIVNAEGKSCGNCERHCPTKSIQMVPKDPSDPKSLQIPVVNVETCIGCGACEHLCPARPHSAIYVQGHEVHRTI